MEDRIRFDTGEPIWMVEIHYSAGVTSDGRKYSQGVFPVTLNADTEEEALLKAGERFQAEGFNVLHILGVQVTRLEVPENGG